MSSDDQAQVQAPPPTTTPETTAPEPSKEIAKREVNITGRHTCPACEESVNDLSHRVESFHSYPVERKFIELDSEEGQSRKTQFGIKSIPHIEDCKTYKDGRKDCRTLEGYEPNDFADLTDTADVGEV